MTDNQEEKINDRFIKIRKTLKMSQKDFGSALGYNQSSISEMEKGTKNISKAILFPLSSIFNIDIDWLRTGDGEMFKPVSPDVYTPKHENAKDLGEITHPSDVSDTPFIDLKDGKYLMIMPLIGQYAYAGYLAGWSDTEFIEELPKHSIIVDKYHRGQYRAFEVVGDSMDNNSKESIPDGCIVTGRHIGRDLWKSKFHTHRYSDYVIVSKTEGIIVKRIVKHDVPNGIVTLASLNPDKISYPDFEMNLDDVSQIFNIVAITQKR